METLITYLLGIVILIPLGAIIVTAIAVWRGYVLATLWSWFIVPVFGGLPEINTIIAIGIALMVGMFIPSVYDATEDKDNTKEIWTKVFTKDFLSPALALLIGYILTYFI